MNIAPSSWADQLAGLCITLLIGAAALYGAFLLVQAIWVWIVAGIAISVALIGFVWLLRLRSRPW